MKLYCSQCGWQEYNKTAGQRCSRALGNGKYCARKLRAQEGDPRKNAVPRATGAHGRGGRRPIEDRVQLLVMLTAEEYAQLEVLAAGRPLGTVARAVALAAGVPLAQEKRDGKRDIKIALYMSADQRAGLRARAAAAGLTVSAFVRGMLRAASRGKEHLA